MKKVRVLYGFIFFIFNLFQIEGGVLLLSHFNETTNANFSVTDKKEGKCIDVKITEGAKGYPFADSKPTPEALDIGYERKVVPEAGLYYDSSNIDVRQGTIQMFVKTSWDWANTQEERLNKVVKNRYFLTLKLKEHKKEGIWASLNLYFACDQGHHFRPHLVFYIYDGKKDYILSIPVGPDSPTSNIFNWRKDNWHYIVATWTPTKICLYADGKKLGEKNFEIPMDVLSPDSPIIIGNHWREKIPAEALIDELRILDFPLEESQACKIPETELSPSIKGEAGGAAGPATYYKSERKKYYVYKISEPPKIDGDLNDKCWENIPVITGFKTLGIDGKYTNFQTEVKIAYDEKNLYFAIYNYENKINALRAKCKENQNMEIFGDDANEILISNKERGKPFFQIGLNSEGISCLLFYDENGKRAFWENRIVTGTKKEENGWTLEVAIPFTSINVETPKIGEKWRFNVCRDRRVEGLEYSSLNPVISSFLESSDFGEFIFYNKPIFSTKEEEKKLNGEFIFYVSEKMEEILDEIEENLKIIDRFSEEGKREYGINNLEKELLKFKDYTEDLKSEKEVSVKKLNEFYFFLERIKNLEEEFDMKSSYISINCPDKYFEEIPSMKEGIFKKDKFWFLTNKYLVCCIDSNSGAIAGLWERVTGNRLVSSSYDIYYYETKEKERKTDERANEVIDIKKSKNTLTLISINPKLPGLKFYKSYYFIENVKEPKILGIKLEITGKTRETTLLTVAMRTVFDEKFKNESYYHRIFVIGTAMNEKYGLCAWAKDIKEKIVQRGWFISDEGRAQFCAINPKLNIGLAQYLYKVNDIWSYPQGIRQSWWTPYGWEIGTIGEFFVNKEERKISGEVRFHLFQGDSLLFHKEYINLPEHKKIMEDYTPHPDMMKIKFPYSIQIEQIENSKYIPLFNERDKLMRPDEIAIGLTSPYDGRWGVLPASDEEEVYVLNSKTGEVVRKIPCKKMKELIEKIKKHYPKEKIGFYRFIGDMYKNSSIYIEHPEWILKNKKGEEISGVFGGLFAAVNWHPDYLEYLKEKLLREVEYFNLDFVYLDFSIGGWVVDWGREEVVKPYIFMEWLKRLQSDLHKRGKFLWLNSFVDQYYYDVGFHEGDECRKNWRISGNIWLIRKFYTKKGNVAIPLYWLGGDMFKLENRDNEERYRNLVLATGLKATGCWLDPYEKHFPDGKGGANFIDVTRYQFPIHATCRELLYSEFVDIGLYPAFWRDFETEFEGYTLKQGNCYFLNVISHYPEPKEGKFTLDSEKMGFKKGKKVFLWEYYPREQKDFIKSSPLPEGWERMFKEYKFTSFVLNSDKIEITLKELIPNTVRMVSLTQIPAFIYSGSGEKTQLLLPENLGCKIEGEFDEVKRKIYLKISANQPIEVITPWEYSEKPIVRDIRNKREILYSFIKISEENFILFHVNAGEYEMEIF